MTNVLLRNNVRTFGDGTPMMFAHGFGCDQNMWRFMTPAFENEFKIILFDYVGAGKSDKASYNPERYSTLNGYADDVIEICEALNLSDIIFFHCFKQAVNVTFLKSTYIFAIVNIAR